MIKFFRKIRKRLLSKNIFSKYLIYALGEIILVIVGILIALQINTRSSNLEKRKTEILYLKQLEKTLRNDYENELIPLKKAREREVEYFQLFKQALDDYPESVSIDSLESLRKWWLPWQLHINISAFEDLNSFGSDLISNDTIRFEISNYYGNEIYWIQKHNRDNHEFNNKYIYPIWFEKLKSPKGGISSSGIELFKSDLYLNNLLNTANSYYMKGSIWRLEDLIPKTEKLLNNLNEEIGRLQK